MIDKELREALDNYAKEQETTFPFFDNPSFDKSIVGISSDNRVIYDYNKMAREFAKDNHCSIQEAIEFIEFNTIRDIPFLGEKAPIIMTPIKEIKERLG